MQKLMIFLAVLFLSSMAAFEIIHHWSWIAGKGNALFCVQVVLSGAVLYVIYKAVRSAWQLHKEQQQFMRDL